MLLRRRLSRKGDKYIANSYGQARASSDAGRGLLGLNRAMDEKAELPAPRANSECPRDAYLWRYATALRPTASRRILALCANIVAFQVAWAGNILGSVSVGLTVSALCLGTHFFLLSVIVPVSHRRQLREALWIVFVVAFGWLVESFLLYTSVLSLDGSSFTVGAVPLWLLLIWACFATTFRFSMHFFVRHPYWALLAGAMACFSYASGVALRGSVSFGLEPLPALCIIAGVWSLAFAAMSECYRRFWELKI